MNKILCVHQSAELYGSDRIFINSVKSIRELHPEAEIDVILPFKGPLIAMIEPHVTKIIIKNFGVIRKSELGFKFIFKFISKFIWSAYRNLNRYDLVYVNTIVIVDYLIASLLTKKKPIYHVHELPEGKILKWYCFLFSKTKVRLIYNSHTTKEKFTELLSSKQNSVIIENGIRGYSSCTELKEEDFNKKINIVLIGRIYPRKGHQILLSAISKLESEIKNRINLRFVGDFLPNDLTFKSELLNQIQDLSLDQNVSFVGFSEKPQQQYEWAHIVAIPSTLPESFGLVGIEALSAGRIVIASAHGGIVDFIID